MTEKKSAAPARHDLGVLIGRMEPPHRGHEDAIRQATESCDRLLVQLGSAASPRSYFAPFTYAERAAMLRASLDELSPELSARVAIEPLPDQKYNDAAWAASVRDAALRELVRMGHPMGSVALAGHRKDGTGFYLDFFPDWGEIPLADTTGLSSTPIRSDYFLSTWELGERSWGDPAVVPPAVARFMEEFRRGPDFARVVAEYEHVRDYQAPYRALPFPPVFVTVDPVVVQGGHVLLVRRGEMPGLGLWALPGGFLDVRSGERIEDGIFRELDEETQIRVPPAVLRGALREIRVFDDPHRSSRGRTITHAGLIVLDGQRPLGGRAAGPRSRLPRVVGSDDAREAKWWPLAGPGAIRPEHVFEDHYSIILALTAGL